MQGVWLASLLLPWILAYRIAEADGPPWLGVSYAIAAAGALGCGLIAYLDGKGQPIGFTVSLAVLNVAVVTPELWLRLRHFHFEPGIQFGFPNTLDFQRLSPIPTCSGSVLRTRPA